MPLDPSSRDLAALALRSVPDGMLIRLARLARGGAGWSVSVVVGGTLISGDLTSPEKFAENMDRMMVEALEERIKTHPDQTWAKELRDFFAGPGAFAPVVRDVLAEQDRAQDELEALGESEPDEELDRRVLEATEPGYLNLNDAYVFPPNGPAFNVPMVRVRISEVGAWWVGKTTPSV
jgi:hypothetical protein